MVEIVSVVMATIPERAFFLGKTVERFLKQSYPNKELVVVSDDPEFDQSRFPNDPRVQYVVLKRPTNLGAKMNVGIEHAKGTFIMKLDDDDWHHPDLITGAMQALCDTDLDLGITRFRRFPMFFVKLWKMVAVGYYDAKAGNAMCFDRKIWERKPFRDVPRRVDTYFWEDHPETVDSIIRDERLICMVRHGIRHLWTSTYPDISVDDFFSNHRPEWETPVEKFFPSEDLEFYKRVREELLNGAQTGGNRIGL
jgi:glycosyltransferase involved in cell wall biosynthesis